MIQNTSALYTPPAGGILAHIQSYLAGKGIPSYRYQQLVKALQRGTENFEELRTLPKAVRHELIAQFGVSPLPLSWVESQQSAQVEKVLFRTKAGAQIETVLSQYRAGWSSMCISSQSGCGLGCTFCATGAMGLMKNLTPDEICAQVFHPHWKQNLPDSIAFMGMGEALANPHIFQAIDTFTHQGYGGISARRITVSTVGFAPHLERLVQQYPQVNITLSVHSPFPDQRATLIPLEKRFPLAENMRILDQYVQQYHRKVYLAYLLIAGVNDTSGHAQALAQLVQAQYRPELYHVSVIRYNTAWGANPDFRQPTPERVSAFVQQLQQQGIRATRRTQFGSAIEAACGQLHTDYLRRQAPSGSA